MSNHLETICRDCIFATFVGNKQVGCKFHNRLDKFKQQERAYLTEEGYYKIDGYCNACRNGEWAKRAGDVNHLELVDKSLKLEVDYIMLGIARQYSNKEINRSVKRLTKAKYKPRAINIILYNQKLSYVQLYQELSDILLESDIKYNVTTVYEKGVDIPRAIDIGFKKVSSQYYAVFEVGYEVPLNHVRKLNRLINHDLRRVSMIEPEDGINGLTVQSLLHRNLSGNIECEFVDEDGNTTTIKPIQDKIKWMARAQKKEAMVMEYNAL